MAVQKPTISMFRGDYRELEVIVSEPYSATAELHFAAKPSKLINPEDETDTNAIVMVDAVGSTDSVDNGDGTTTWTLKFVTANTDDKAPGTYIGEIEYIDATGKHTTADQFIFILKGDVNQRPA